MVVTALWGQPSVSVCSRLTGTVCSRGVLACAGSMGKPADQIEELGGTTRLQQTKLGELGMPLCFDAQVHLCVLHCEPRSGLNQV